MLTWPRMEVEFHGVSTHTWRTKTTKKGVALVSDDTSACRTTLSMSSSSYSGLTLQEIVHRTLKESIIAPKTVSSENAEEQVMPSNIEQLISGLPKSSEVVRNVDSIVDRRGLG